MIRPVLWVLWPGGTRELLVAGTVIATAVSGVLPVLRWSGGCR
ncbi:MAG: hypothetical protein ACYCVN_05365 [Acidimicrobiales bacterium]